MSEEQRDTRASADEPLDQLEQWLKWAGSQPLELIGRIRGAQHGASPNVHLDQIKFGARILVRYGTLPEKEGLFLGWNEQATGLWVAWATDERLKRGPHLSVVVPENVVGFQNIERYEPKESQGTEARLLTPAEDYAKHQQDAVDRASHYVGTPCFLCTGSSHETIYHKAGEVCPREWTR